MYGQNEPPSGNNPGRLVLPQDLDAERWKPMNYAVNIDVPVVANGIGRGYIQLNNQPIFITRVSCEILGNTEDPETSGLYQDGQYFISMNDEQRNYSNIPVMADLLFGPKRVGPWRSLEYPLQYAASHALRFEIINVYTRVLTPISTTFTVQICLSGLADWGVVQRNM
jgi:hypothetical protein